MDDWCNTFLALICQIAHSEPPTHSLTNAFLIQAAPSFTDPSALYFVKLMLTVFLLATSLYLSNLHPSYFFAQSAVVFHYGFHSRICRIFDKWIPDRLFIAMMTRGRDEVISGLCDKLRKRRKRNQSLDFYHLTLSTLIQINDIHPTHFFGQRIWSENKILKEGKLWNRETQKGENRDRVTCGNFATLLFSLSH